MKEEGSWSEDARNVGAEWRESQYRLSRALSPQDIGKRGVVSWRCGASANEAATEMSPTLPIVVPFKRQPNYWGMTALGSESVRRE
jgi:hypothetical protein